MQSQTILSIFVILKVLQQLLEHGLLSLNREYYENTERRREAQSILGIDDTSMNKTLAYSRDKYRFNLISSWTNLIIFLAFLIVGGLGWIESWSYMLAASLGLSSQISIGLIFFAILGLLSTVTSLPFQWYATFHLEQKHGFNRQTPKGFWMDLIKSLLIGAIMGGLLLALILWIMIASGGLWWLYAWIAICAFSLLTAWLYPSVLAPLFNKFNPVGEGELREKIFTLANKVDFNTSEIYVMDASKRSSHGNAYFTGVFGQKRIVLFDTLVKSLNADEIVAVLAHELGHFKLHHVRWGLVRGFLMAGLMFYVFSRVIDLSIAYEAFGLKGVSMYGALLVFSLWFGVVSFFIQPISHWISQRHEFQADAFAIQKGDAGSHLSKALLKLRETSQSMPISHPLFSLVYLSHPPLVERLKVLNKT